MIDLKLLKFWLRAHIFLMNIGHRFHDEWQRQKQLYEKYAFIFNNGSSEKVHLCTSILNDCDLLKRFIYT